jgi:hypothetical protein
MSLRTAMEAEVKLSERNSIFNDQLLRAHTKTNLFKKECFVCLPSSACQLVICTINRKQ